MLHFLLCALVAALFLLAPGYVLLRLLRLGRGYALAFAPAGSVALTTLLAVAYGFVGLSCSPTTLVLVPTVLLTIPLALDLWRGRTVSLKAEAPQDGPDLIALGLYLVMGLGASTLVFARHLPAYDAINEAWDTVHHLNAVRAFVESGRFSSLSTSVYLADPATNPVTSAIGFYPSAWKAFCALLVQATGCGVAYSINATNYAVCAFAYPLCMFGFLADVFRDRPQVVRAGAFATVSFAVFPWGLLVFGPLYPNLLGFALLPFSMWIIKRVVERVAVREFHPADVAMVLVMFVAGTLSHPNALFSAAVFAIVYVTWALPRLIGGGHEVAPRVALAARAAFLVVVAVLWNALYALPFMADLLAYHWPAYTTPAQAVVNILTLAYVYIFNSASAQLLLGVLVLVGALLLVRRREHPWMLATYLFACFILFVDITADDALKPVLTGFWYKEPYRISAMAAIFAAPMAAVGLEWAVRMVMRLLRVGEDAKPATRLVATLVALVVYLAVVFCPTYTVPGQTIPTSTGFSTMFDAIKNAYDDAHAFLDSDERAFVQEAARVTGDALVENNPFDGSLIAYGEAGMRVVNRNLQGYDSSSETADAKLLRTSLDEIASRDDVREAASRMGVRYVLVVKRSATDEQFFKGYYDQRLWQGVTSIDEETPGFNLVMERGRCQLYEVVAE